MIDRNLYSACLLILTFKHTPETPENENYVSEFKDLRKRCRLHIMCCRLSISWHLQNLMSVFCYFCDLLMKWKWRKFRFVISVDSEKVCRLFSGKSGTHRAVDRPMTTTRGKLSYLYISLLILRLRFVLILSQHLQLQQGHYKLGHIFKW